MRQDVLVNYTNPRDILNITHIGAWGIAIRVAKLGWHNLRHRFMPPIIEGVTLVPNDPEGPTEPFEHWMFKEGGFLHERGLNHYVRLKVGRRPESYLLNAGFLNQALLQGDDIFYSHIKEMISHAKEGKATRVGDSQGANSGIQAEGPED